MGAGSSKELHRQTPRRKSRRKFYGVLKHNFDLIEHKMQLERLTDEEYDIVRQLIETSKNDLLAVAGDVANKPKYKQMYNECLQVCDGYEMQLRSKRVPVSAPASPSVKKRRKKKSERKERKSLLTPEEESFAAIHRIRQEMQPLRDEVLTFKGARNDRIYHFLQESFHRYVQKLRLIELYDRVQLKYEVAIAINYAIESQSVLDQICDGKRRYDFHQQRSIDETFVADEAAFVANTTVMRNRSKSMGDYLHKTGNDDFCGRRKHFTEYPDYPGYSSDSDYAQTSDFSDVPMTPNLIKANSIYNFKVTAI